VKSKFITLFKKMKAFLSKMTISESFGLELEASLERGNISTG